MKFLKMILIVPWLVACAGQSGAKALNCDEAYTTVEINRCALQEFKQSERDLQRYYEKVITLNQNDETFIESITQSQSHWLMYRKGHCDSVYTYWRDGTIRSLQSITCKTQLTQERTLQLWQNFLTFVDDTDIDGTDLDSTGLALPKPEYFLEQESR